MQIEEIHTEGMHEDLARGCAVIPEQLAGKEEGVFILSHMNVDALLLETFDGLP